MNRVQPVAATLLALALVNALGGTARAAGQRYQVSGHDSFVIGDGDIQSETEYRGTQVLTVSHRGKITRYVATAAYERSDQGAATKASADFVIDLLPSGDQIASADHDPDYLTILNQPFSARLDPKTLRDLRGLKGRAPFDFPSPFTGSAIHGHLDRAGSGFMGPHHVLGVRFEAAGPMNGRLPDRPGLSLVGGIAMSGTAYYDLDTALLVSLDATVTITGKVSNRNGNDPVTIVYRRTIRADDSPRGFTQEARSSPKP
jgi:hypothetical protein